MVYIILAAVFLLVIIGLNVWRVKRKEKQKQYDQKLKEQALTESLKNGRGKNNGFHKEHGAQSMDQLIENEHLVERNRVIVRLTVSGRQNSDYILSPEKHILIGKTPEMNEIVVEGDGIAGQQCDIFLYRDQVYIKNLYPAYPVVIRRKNNQMTLSGQAVRMITGDRITIGGNRILVSLMDYVGNTIQG